MNLWENIITFAQTRIHGTEWVTFREYLQQLKDSQMPIIPLIASETKDPQAITKQVNNALSEIDRRVRLYIVSSTPSYASATRDGIFGEERVLNDGTYCKYYRNLLRSDKTEQWHKILIRPASEPSTTADDDILAYDSATGEWLPQSTATLNIVTTSRTINTTTPLTGGGDLSANRTFGIGGLTTVGTANYVVGVNSGGTAWEYKAVTGTANRVTVTHAANLITLSGPQDLHTGASPTFTGLTLSGDLLVDGGDIGLTGDTDLVQLSSGVFRVNGEVRQFPTTGEDLYHRYVSLVTTTDATTATIQTFTLGQYQTRAIRAMIAARDGTAGTDHAGYMMYGTFYREGNGTTQQGSTSAEYTEESAGAGAWGTSFSVNGNDVRVQVTGAAGVSITWKAVVEVL